MRWQFEWHRRWDSILAPPFLARWEALLARAPLTTPYHTPALVSAWADTCGATPGVEPLVGIATGDLGEVLLPLVVVTTRGRFMSRRVVEYVGQDLYSYSDPLASFAGAPPAVWSELWDRVRMETAGACHQGVLRSVNSRFADREAVVAEGAPVLEMEGVANLAAVLARCSANHRGEIHRRYRRLAERGEIALRVCGARDREGTEQAIEQLLAAYETRRERRPEYPSLGRHGLRELWRRIAVEGTRGGWSHLSVLTVNDEPVAWHLGLLRNGELYWWVPAHDPRWEALSPGKVLLAKLVEAGIAAGWRRVHLLAGTQPYKMAWRPQLPERRVVRWHAPTIAGALLERYDRRAVL